MKIEVASEKCHKIIETAQDTFVSRNSEILKKALCAFISGGHILFEDNPGLGKTLLVKLFAKIMGCDWKRIQFTPDLLPADITGTKIWRGSQSEFILEKGPVFTNLLLADEINRAMPKTQSALLEAMEERQVTIEGVTHQLSLPFIVMATQNPVEMEGTYNLPEAQTDRFAIRLSIGYQDTIEDECEILKRRILWCKDDPVSGLANVISQAELLDMQAECEKIYIDESILLYICEIIRKTRTDSRVSIGSSPRGGIALLKLSRAHAMVSGRDFVIPDDVKMFAVETLAHRIILNIEHSLEGLRPEKVINDIVQSIDVPKDYTRG